MTLLQFHFLVTGAWLGALGVESVMELSARDTAMQKAVGRIHASVDRLVEGPLAAAVLISGVWLLVRAWPAPPMLLVKAGCGLFVVALFIVSMPFVHERGRTDDPARLRLLTQRILLTGIGIPVAFVALYLGLTHPW